jgi:hypothetical protein
MPSARFTGYHLPKLWLEIHRLNNGYHGYRSSGKQKLRGLVQSIIRIDALRQSLQWREHLNQEKRRETLASANAARRLIVQCSEVCRRLGNFTPR